MRRAKDTLDANQRTESLRESLRSVLSPLDQALSNALLDRLFIKAVKHLSMERVKEICAEYNEMRYPLGAPSPLLITYRTDPTHQV